jgi:hypothetical protein
MFIAVNQMTTASIKEGKTVKAGLHEGRNEIQESEQKLGIRK